MPNANRLARWIVGLALLAALAGCTAKSGTAMTETRPTVSATPQPDGRGIAFEEVASDHGLRYRWPKQRRPMRTPEAFGTGCATFDYDLDGWQDVLLVGDPHPSLFHNVGGGRFVDVTEASGLKACSGDWIGCAIGDYDGDGDLDVLVTGMHALALFRNADGKTFENVTSQVGLDAANFGHWASSAGFMDLDGDQWLDLVLLNVVKFGPDSKQFCEIAQGVMSSCRPVEYEREQGEVWQNTGHGGFRLIPAEQGMAQTSGVCLVLSFSDLNDDGRMDFYIGNDGPPADLMRNKGDMHFENVAWQSGLAVDGRGSPLAAMGSDFADSNRDGALDLTVTNFQNMFFVLFRNLGQGVFTDDSDTTGIARATRDHLGFGAKWIDFDNDGWPDISYANGHVYENSAKADVGATFRQTQVLLHNRLGKQFVDLVPTLSPKLARPILGRGSATADFDNDGRMDLLLVDYEGQPMLMENRSETGNHWLKLDLRGPKPNAFAYGAKVTASTGDQKWIAEVSPASSYLSSSDPRIHWGLGTTEKLETLSVRWPSGKVETWHDVAADRILRLEPGAPTPSPVKKSPPASKGQAMQKGLPASVAAAGS